MENKRSHMSRIRTKEEIENALVFLEEIQAEAKLYTGMPIGFKERLAGLLFTLKWVLKKDKVI